MKFKDIYNNWLKDKQQYVKRSTISAYTLLAKNHVLPFFNDFESITEDDVQAFVFSKLKDGISKKTISDMLIVLKMVVKYGSKKNLFTYKDWNINYPTSSNSTDKIETLSVSEYKIITKYLYENITLRNIGILLCLQGGLRIGEVCALQWKDLDVDNKTIKISNTIQRIYNNEKQIKNGINYRGKTELIIDSAKTKNSIREIPLTGRTYQILKKMASFSNPDYFIMTNESKPTEPRTYRNYYKTLLKKTGVKHVKFHGLRHTFATRCIEAKVDVKTLSTILGHSNVTTTYNLYVHPSCEQKQTAIDSVFKKFG